MCDLTAFLVVNENYQPIYNSMGKREDGIFDRQYPESNYNNARKGSVIVVDGKPCKVVDMSTCKTGKHGSAKVLLSLLTRNNMTIVNFLLIIF